MKFGEMLEKLQADKTLRAYRLGWNGVEAGKEMFLVLNGGYELETAQVRQSGFLSKEYLESKNLKSLKIHPHLDLWVNNSLVVGWLASQLDIFADDWQIM